MFCQRKHYHVTEMSDGDKPFKIICQNCHGYVRCDGKSGELLYITFINSGMSNLGICHEELVP